MKIKRSSPQTSTRVHELAYSGSAARLLQRYVETASTVNVSPCKAITFLFTLGLQNVVKQLHTDPDEVKMFLDNARGSFIWHSSRRYDLPGLGFYFYNDTVSDFAEAKSFMYSILRIRKEYEIIHTLILVGLHLVTTQMYEEGPLFLTRLFLRFDPEPADLPYAEIANRIGLWNLPSDCVTYQ